MIDDANKDELIEQYLLGELSGSLLDEFKEKLATDDQFRREVALQKALIRNIKSAGRKEWTLELESIHHEAGDYNNGKEKLKPVKIVNSRKYFFAAAAATVFIVLSTFYLTTLTNHPNPEKMYMAYFKPYPALEQRTRALNSDMPSVKEKAFKAYKDTNYPESIRLFESILVKREDELVLFYLGNAYLSVNDAKAAEAAFKRYLNKYKEFAAESKWYLSLCYLKQGRTEEAKKLLHELAGDNKAYSKEANQMLSQW